jgi:hypothetical protein
MEPQLPPVPFSAITHGQQQPQHPTSDYEYIYNEKDAYTQQQQQNTRAERGSKQSSNDGHGRDSVISHPFSPKQSYPPSPASSISSADAQKHRSITEIQSSSQISNGQSITRPAQAHLDPEKHGYGSSQGHRSHRNSGSARAANDAVYDQSEYHEKAPEEKAWQLLVSSHFVFSNWVLR